MRTIEGCRAANLRETTCYTRPRNPRTSTRRLEFSPNPLAETPRCKARLRWTIRTLEKYAAAIPPEKAYCTYSGIRQRLLRKAAPRPCSRLASTPRCKAPVRRLIRWPRLIPIALEQDRKVGKGIVQRFGGDADKGRAEVRNSRQVLLESLMSAIRNMYWTQPMACHYCRREAETRFSGHQG